MKRKLFSKRDGTTFLEDVKGISEDVKSFFNALPARLKKWIGEAEKIVDALESLDTALQNGQPLDTAIDFVLSRVEGEADEIIYEAIKEKLHQFLEDISILDEWELSGDAKFAMASDVLSSVSGLSRIEADTTTQIAVFIKKS